MEVEGARPKEMPRNTWLEVVKNDTKRLGHASSDALDRGEGRLWGTCADSRFPRAPLGFFP